MTGGMVALGAMYVCSELICYFTNSPNLAAVATKITSLDGWAKFVALGGASTAYVTAVVGAPSAFFKWPHTWISHWLKSRRYYPHALKDYQINTEIHEIAKITTPQWEWERALAVAVRQEMAVHCDARLAALAKRSKAAGLTDGPPPGFTGSFE